MSKSGLIAGLGFGIAIGVLGGVYVLAPNVPGAPGAQSSSTEAELEEQRSEAERAGRDAEASDAMVSELAAAAVDKELRGKRVAVVSFPDANPDTAKKLKWLASKAGADIESITLEPEILNPEKGDKLKSLAANSLPAGAQLSEEFLSPGMHTGQVFGAALSSKLPPLKNTEEQSDRGGESSREEAGARGTGKPASSTDRSVVFGALEKNDVLKAPKDFPEEGVDLVVILTGEDAESEGGSEAESGYAAQFIADFAAGIDSQVPGAVLAGEKENAAKGTAVGIVRNERAFAEKLSTVDNVDRSAGRITVIRALKEQAEGGAGHYGAAENAKSATLR